MAAPGWHSLTTTSSTVKARAGIDWRREAPHPLIIGATGGSGTRVLTCIAQHAGLFMGANLNHALDSRDTAAVVQKWLPPYLKHGTALPAAERQQMTAEFESALAEHRTGIPDARAPWGFKNPR